MSGLELFIHHIRHLPLSQAKYPRKGDGCGWCFRGVQQSCGIQERMMRRPRSDLRSWRDFCVLLLGVEWFQLQELLEPVIVNVNSKATFCPPGAAAVTCASNLGIERSDASAAVDKRFSLRVIFCIQAQHTVLLLRSLNPWHRSAIPLGHYQYLML